MSNRLEPVVGQWYAHRDKGEMFQVVAVDVPSGYIEIQSFDGDVEETDRDVWGDMDIEPIEAPEDASGPFDDVESDSAGSLVAPPLAMDWRQLVESLDAANGPWADSEMFE